MSHPCVRKGCGQPSDHGVCDDCWQRESLASSAETPKGIALLAKLRKWRDAPAPVIADAKADPNFDIQVFLRTEGRRRRYAETATELLALLGEE